ncbi:MAG: tRNA lysidine(34) synthetase TilS [Chthoniobacterales bacterium]
MEKTASADPFLAKLAAHHGAKSRRALVAVSGGRDSVALLHGLHALGFRKLTVVHLDHQLRGRASKADASFVARLAKKLGRPCTIGHADVKSYAASRVISIELAARELRHVFFAQCARRERCTTVFLAHHADDQIETCLFNFLRGSGAAGLAGMSGKSELTIGRTRLELLRPMLGIRRAEIHAFIAQHRIKFREDATNSELAATRNKLRHRVIPAIRESMGDSFGAAILRAAQIFEAEDDWMEIAASSDAQFDHLPVSTLKTRPLALIRRTLRRWLALQNFQPTFEMVELVRSLLAPEAKVAKVNLPGGAHCRRRAGMLFIERP